MLNFTGMNYITSILSAILFTLPVFAADRPNIVFILADDLGCTDLGATGSDYYLTPNLDKFATQALHFTSAYSNCANCAPTRAALMSGMYAPRTGIYTVGESDRGDGKGRMLIPTENKTRLEPSVVTIAEVLRDAGYNTAMMGKWHLGDGETGPKNQGFDYVPYYAHGTRSFIAPYKTAGLPNDAPEGEYLSDRLAQEAAKFMKSQKGADKPFFLYLPFFSVHTPINPKPDLVEKAKQRIVGVHHKDPQYAGFVESLDGAVGLVLSAIDELGLADNTIVIFASDNGGNGTYTDQHPLRGSKGMFYEGGIRTPLFVRYPGVAKAGATCDEPVTLLDFYPTLTEIAGGKHPTGQPVDGKSLLPLFKDNQQALGRDAIYFHFPCYLQGYPGGENEEAQRSPWRATPCSVIRSGDWKLIEYYETGKVELFNLKDDVGEARDLSQTNKEKAVELLGKLHAWQKSVDAPIPTQRNPAYEGQ